MFETITILLLSVVQSVFGVGILVFGTPVLLLGGLELVDVMATLVPASLMISLLQVFTFRDDAKLIGKEFFAFCVIPLCGALGLGLQKHSPLLVEIAVSVMLLTSSIFIHMKSLIIRSRNDLSKFRRPILFAMGVTHGISNMGGSLLTMYVAIHSNDKNNHLAAVSRGYLTFGLVQLFILYLVYDVVPSLNSLWSALAAIFAYLIVGKNVAARLPQSCYDSLLSIAMIAFVVLIVVF